MRMNKLEKARYTCRNHVNWKATFILISAVSLLWAIVLFVPRPGENEKTEYFYLLLSFGLCIDLLILYSGILRRWAKTWIIDGLVYSDYSSRLLLPVSGKIALEDVREICFIFNASLHRKKIDNPSSKVFKRMKEKLAEKIDSLVASRQITDSVSLDDETYSFPAYCGRLVLKGDQDESLPIDLNVSLFRANLREVKKFVSFFPKETKHTWRYGRVSISTKGSMP